MKTDQYKLDRNHVEALSFSQADDHTIYWYDKTVDERLNAGCFLIINSMALRRKQKLIAPLQTIENSAMADLFNQDF